MPVTLVFLQMQMMKKIIEKVIPQIWGLFLSITSGRPRQCLRWKRGSGSNNNNLALLSNIAIIVDITVFQPGLCSAARDCHPSADCLYNREGGYYRWWLWQWEWWWQVQTQIHRWWTRCECLRGYVGDGLNCSPGPDADCRILRNCHQVIIMMII